MDLSKPGQQRKLQRQLRESERERKALKRRYARLFDGITAILARNDPINIAYLPDEYEPETGTILPRLREATSASDVRRIVHEEFVRWFSAEDAGSEDRYGQIAEEIWDVWRNETRGRHDP